MSSSLFLVTRDTPSMISMPPASVYKVGDVPRKKPDIIAVKIGIRFVKRDPTELSIFERPFAYKRYAKNVGNMPRYRSASVDLVSQSK